MTTLKSKSVEELKARLDVLEDWQELSRETRGEADTSQRYAPQRHRTFNSDTIDYADAWNNPYDIDDELATRDEDDEDTDTLLNAVSVPVELEEEDED